MWRRNSLETVTNSIRDGQAQAGGGEAKKQADTILTSTGPIADDSQHSQKMIDPSNQSCLDGKKKIPKSSGSWFAPSILTTSYSDDSNPSNAPATTTSTTSRLPFARRRGSKTAAYDPKDETIAALERTGVMTQESLKSLKIELTEHKRTQKKELQAKQVALDAANKELTLQQQHMKSMIQDLNDDSLSEALDKVIKEAAPDDIPLSWLPHQQEYIHRLESKLSKAMHRLRVLTNHTQDLKEMHKEYAKSMQEELIQVSEERVSMEVEHLNRIDTLEHEKILSEQALLSKLEMKQTRIWHLEDMMDELRTSAAASSTSISSSHGSGESGTDEMLGTSQVETIVAVGALKEELEQVIRERNDLEEKTQQKEKGLLAEIERLTLANEAKQKRIDRFETQDALAELECESEHMARRWNDREQLYRKVQVDEEASGNGSDGTGDSMSSGSNRVEPGESTHAEEERNSETSGHDNLDLNEAANVDSSNQIEERIRSNQTFVGSRLVLKPSDPVRKLSESQRKIQEARLERYL